LSSLFTKKQDAKMIQNIDNKQDTSKHLLDKLSVGDVISRLSFHVHNDIEEAAKFYKIPLCFYSEI
jgi:hypothetical protein